jgi:hypothetical protein
MPAQLCGIPQTKVCLQVYENKCLQVDENKCLQVYENKCLQVYENKCLQVFKKLVKFYQFSGWLCQPRFLNKDPTFWLDGARPANTCIPFFHPVNMPA